MCQRLLKVIPGNNKVIWPLTLTGWHELKNIWRSQFSEVRRKEKGSGNRKQRLFLALLLDSKLQMAETVWLSTEYHWCAVGAL